MAAEQPPAHIVNLAVAVSQWSPCRSKRGVVIFDGPEIITHGHNRPPRGMTCDGSLACKATCRREAIHAEQLALLHCSHDVRGMELLHVKSVEGALVASGGPSCLECSKLMLEAGLAAVWLFHDTGWHRYPMRDFHECTLASVALNNTETPDGR